MNIPTRIQNYMDKPAQRLNIPQDLQKGGTHLPTDAEYREMYRAQQQKGLGKKTKEFMGAIPGGVYSVVAEQWIPALQDESLVKGLFQLDEDAYTAVGKSVEIGARDLWRIVKSAHDFLGGDEGLSEEAKFQKWLKRKKENDQYFHIVRPAMAQQAAGGKYAKDMQSLPDFLALDNWVGAGTGVLNRTVNMSIRKSIKYGVGKPIEYGFRSLEYFGKGAAKVGGFPARVAEKIPTGIIPYRALQGVSGYAALTGSGGALATTSLAFTAMETMGVLAKKTGRNTAELARIFSEPSSHARFLFRVSQDASVSPKIRSLAATAYRLGGTKLYDAAFDMIAAGVGSGVLQAAIQAAAGFNAEEIGAAVGGGMAFGAPIGLVAGRRGSGKDTRVVDDKGNLTARSEQGIKDYLTRKVDMESKKAMIELRKVSPESAVLLSTLDAATNTAGIRMTLLDWDAMAEFVARKTGKRPPKSQTPAGNYDPSTRMLTLNKDQLKLGVQEAAHTIAHELGHDHLVQMIGTDAMTRRMVLEDFVDESENGQEFFFYDNNGDELGSIMLNKEAQDFAQAYHDRIEGGDPRQAKQILHDAELLANEMGAEHFASLFANNPNVFDAFTVDFRSTLLGAARNVLAKFGIVDEVSGAPMASNAIQRSAMKNKSIKNLFMNYLKGSHKQVLQRATDIEKGTKITPRKGQTDAERFKELFGGVGVDLASGGMFTIKDDAQYQELLAAEVLALADPDMKYAGVGKGKEGQNLHPEFIRIFTEGARDPEYARLLIQHAQDEINARNKITMGYRSGSRKKFTGYNPFHVRSAVGWGWQISPAKPSTRYGVKSYPNLKLMGYNQDVVLHNIDIMAKAGLIKDVAQFQRDFTAHAKNVFTNTGEEGRINPEGMGENERFAMAFGHHVATPESMKMPRHKDFFLDPKNGLKKAMVSYDFAAMTGFASTGEAGFAFDYRHIRDNYMPRNFPTKQSVGNYMPSELTSSRKKSDNNYMPAYSTVEGFDYTDSRVFGGDTELAQRVAEEYKNQPIHIGRGDEIRNLDEEGFEQFHPSERQRRGYPNKPRGLWFAHGGDWLQYTARYMPNIAKFAHQLNLNNDRVITVDRKNVTQFEKDYGWGLAEQGADDLLIDWRAVARDWSGVFVKVDQLENRQWTSGWDINSGAIWEQAGLESTNFLGGSNEVITNWMPSAPNTPEFRNWFKGSKVVDKDGNPLVVYHGSLESIEQFENHSGFTTGYGFFTESPEQANKFIQAKDPEGTAQDWLQDGILETPAPNITPVFLSIDKLFDYENTQHRQQLHSRLDPIAIPESRQYGTRGSLSDSWEMAQYSEIVKDLGFEGMKLKEDGIPQYIPFAPEQIKSATGNRGTFNPRDKRITHMPAAYHGSPHKFDKFDMSKIGTGEGAQAYGHGLYFASKREVAEHYRRMGYDPEKMKVNGRLIMDEYHHFTRRAATSGDYEIAEGLERLMMHESPDQVLQYFRENNFGEEAIKYFEKMKYETFGSLHKVELTPKENEYLLWDKPLSEQPKGVREKVRKVLEDDPNFHQPSIDRFMEVNTGGEFYNSRTALSQPAPRVSKALKEAGIRGIKYLDGNSRFEGKGSYNYVIFDTSDITVKERYFMPAAKGRGYVGHIDEDGHVVGLWGDLSKMDHSELEHKYPLLAFRYTQDSKTVHWWEKPTRQQKDIVTMEMEAQGKEVKRHRVFWNLMDEDQFREMHGGYHPTRPNYMPSDDNLISITGRKTAGNMTDEDAQTAWRLKKTLRELSPEIPLETPPNLTSEEQLAYLRALLQSEKPRHDKSHPYHNPNTPLWLRGNMEKGFRKQVEVMERLQELSAERERFRERGNFMPANPTVMLLRNILSVDVLNSIKQDKFSPNEFRKKLNGVKGAKEFADDVKLDEFFEGKKSVTKQEVAEHISKNLPLLNRKQFGSMYGQATDGAPKHKSWRQLGAAETYEEHLFRLPESYMLVNDTSGGHYNDDQVIFHYRKTTRAKANEGEDFPQSVYYLEEVQSDIHQLGKRVGYAENSPEYQDRLAEYQFMRRDRGKATDRNRKDATLQAISKWKDDLQNYAVYDSDLELDYSPFRHPELQHLVDEFIERELATAGGDLSSADYVTYGSEFMDRACHFAAEYSKEAVERGLVSPLPSGDAIDIESFYQWTRGEGHGAYDNHWNNAAQELVQSDHTYHPTWKAKYKELQDEFAFWDDASEDAKPPTSVPFKKSWHSFVLKQAMMAAHMEGNNFIAWTTGELAAKLFNMDKYFQSVTVTSQTRSDGSAAYTINWVDLNNQTGTVQNLTPKGLKREIGKEAAAQSVEFFEGLRRDGEMVLGSTFEITDLKNEHKGLRKHYDESMVSAAKAIAKELGIDPPRKMRIEVMKKRQDWVDSSKAVETKDTVEVWGMKMPDLTYLDMPLYMPASPSKGGEGEGIPHISRRSALKALGGGIAAALGGGLTKYAPQEPVGRMFPIASKEHLEALITNAEGMLQNYYDDGSYHSDAYYGDDVISNNMEDLQSIIHRLDGILDSGKIPEEIDIYSNFEADMALDVWENAAFDDESFPVPQFGRRTLLTDQFNQTGQLGERAGIEGETVSNDTTRIRRNYLAEILDGTTFEKGSTSTKMIGYRVMRAIDKEGKKVAVSGANARDSFTLSNNKEVTQSSGLFLSNDPEFVKKHYAVHDQNVLLKMEFDHDDIQSGNVADQQPEISVSKAKILDHEILGEGNYMPSNRNRRDALKNLGIEGKRLRVRDGGVTLPIYSVGHLNRLMDDYDATIDKMWREGKKDRQTGKAFVARSRTAAALKRKSEELDLTFPTDITFKGGLQPEIALGHWEHISENATGLIPKADRNRQIDLRDERLNLKESKAIPTKAEQPVVTVRAYKLFRVDPENRTHLIPVSGRYKRSIPIGKWVTAEDMGEKRSGWHASDLPIDLDGKPKKGQVWAEVELGADFDWQTEANSRASVSKDGDINISTAQITDQVPFNGYYRYKNDPKKVGESIIGGQMKINRVLPDEEVKKLNSVAGLTDLANRKKKVSLQKVDAEKMPDSSGSRVDAAHGHVPPAKKRITKTLAKQLNMPANLVGKVAFPMAADRLMVGHFTSRSGQVFELRGGVDHPDMDIHQGVVGWAVMEGGVSRQLENAITMTDGIGLVYLMKEEACASNRSFARVAVDEMMYDMAQVTGGDKIFQRHLSIGLKALKKWAVDKAKKEKKAPDESIMTLEVGDISQLAQVLPELSFDQRKAFLPRIMSDNYKKEMNAKMGLSARSPDGALSWRDLYRQLNDEKYAPDKGWQDGDIVKVIQFDQDNPRIDIVKELGISPDPTYDVSFRGHTVGDTITGHVSVYDVFRHTLDYFAYDPANLEEKPDWKPNPERTIRDDRSVGSNANRTLQMRGLKHGRVTLDESTLIPREEEINFKRETKAQEGYFQDRTERNQQIRREKTGSSYL